jgi:hypothetical protein
MNAQKLSHGLRIEKSFNGGEDVAQVFIDALEHFNFHTEARVIQAAWDAMDRVIYHDSRDAPKLIAAAADALAELK